MMQLGTGEISWKRQTGKRGKVMMMKRKKLSVRKGAVQFGSARQSLALSFHHTTHRALCLLPMHIAGVLFTAEISVFSNFGQQGVGALLVGCITTSQ